MVHLDFKATNNMAEYEALLFGLSTALSLDVSIQDAGFCTQKVLSKQFYDTFAGTATRVAHCGSFVGEGLGVSNVLSYGGTWWKQGFTWFGLLECNTLRT
jgi:hypothetical protein